MEARGGVLPFLSTRISQKAKATMKAILRIKRTMMSEHRESIETYQKRVNLDGLDADAGLTWSCPTFFGSRCNAQHVEDEEQADEEERIPQPIDLVFEDNAIGVVIWYEYQDAEKG